MSICVNINTGSEEAIYYRNELMNYSNVVSNRIFHLGSNDIEQGITAFNDGKRIIVEQEDYTNKNADIITSYSCYDNGIFTKSSKLVKGSMHQEYIGFQVDTDGFVYSFDETIAKEVYRDLLDRTTLLNEEFVEEEDPILKNPIIDNDKYTTILESVQ